MPSVRAATSAPSSCFALLGVGGCVSTATRSSLGTTSLSSSKRFPAISGEVDVSISPANSPQQLVHKSGAMCAGRNTAPPWPNGAALKRYGVSEPSPARLAPTNPVAARAGPLPLIQLAWLWLRNQPQSTLTIWFHERVLRNGGRLRKTTIVALARKLLVTLWKYVESAHLARCGAFRRSSPFRTHSRHSALSAGTALHAP
jgi:hypothetical protein